MRVVVRVEVDAIAEVERIEVELLETFETFETSFDSGVAVEEALFDERSIGVNDDGVCGVSINFMCLMKSD